MSISGWATLRIGSSTRSPSPIEPVQQTTIPRIGLKCISGGTNGSGGALMNATAPPRSSGASAMYSRMNR
jgi:hypothetical protein